MRRIPPKRPVLTEEEKRHRAERFIWQPGDLKVYSGLEALEKERTKVILYDNETPKDND